MASGNGIYRQTTGTAPNRVLTVEWKNWGVAYTSNPELNVQIKLYETTNIIEIVYGPSTIVTSGSLQIGLRGASTSDFNNRSTTADWSATTAGSSNTSTVLVNSFVYPPNGLTWTWTPWAFPPINYVSSTTTQNSNVVSNNSVNNQIIGMQVVTTGYTPGLTITQLHLSTTGSTNPVTDIRNAKVFYTGTSSAFSTATQYGMTVANPNGAFSVTGAQLLSSGTNYFWLTYDVPLTATLNNIIDATCDSIVGSGSMGTVVPVPSAPGGGREIFAANNEFINSRCKRSGDPSGKTRSLWNGCGT
ncbi:MAG: hypothetical protein NTV87_12855 [Ignavibacteriae bacterium]|nr:hypothetical protein [Ignavibacteriota bacterium]